MVEFARQAQLREDEREGAEWNGPPLVRREAIRAGLSRLSAARLQDTLNAEYPHLQSHFDSFREAKAEQNLQTLGDVLGIRNADLNLAIEQLQRAGFLERTGDTWKVPMLYRDGLGITQGKAFADQAAGEDDEGE